MRRTNPFRSSRLPRRSWQAVLFFAVIAALTAWQQQQQSRDTQTSDSSHATSSPTFDSATCRVARVVDGDTIVLIKNKEHVRLIGANTPETVKRNWPVEPWGPEASQFTKDFLVGGEVRLEFDGDRRDKYGRMLAYVWVGDRMLNEELIRAGLARAETQYNYSKEMKSRFRRAENEAKAARRGIWSS